MEIVLQIIFWLSGLAIAYSYVGYPLWLAWRVRGRQLNTLQFASPSEAPHLSVLMAVHNEEKVLREKLDSLIRQEYPTHRFSIWIGSDCSTDATNTILEEYAAQDARIHLQLFTSRQGKPGIINQLAQKAIDKYGQHEGHLFLITDASVMLTPKVSWCLVRHFKTPKLAIVDAHMVHTGMEAASISHSEDSYISWEGQLKQNESILWQRMIGPFGGCYALRSDFYQEVPANFLVDDFYITMRVFEEGGLAINELEAICYEPVGHEMSEEFRRKARISAGNVQNLLRFRKMWWPPVGNPNFAFFSHKVLRWFGPLWLIGLLVSGALLSHNLFYGFLFLFLLVGVFLVPLLDVLLRQLHIHVLLLRHVRYFLVMNLALFAGFIRYIKGIRTNVWQPPKRHAGNSTEHD